jgi:hypothetical protein
VVVSQRPQGLDQPSVGGWVRKLTGVGQALPLQVVGGRLAVP